MKTENYTGLYRGSKGLYSVLIHASILMIALCATSCRSYRETMQSVSKRDSVRVKEIRSVTYVPIPRSQAILKLSRSNLDSLPRGAAYTARSGQASVKARLEGDTVFIDAVCDSLQLRCYAYEKEITRMSGEIRQRQQIEKKERIPFRTACLCCLAGFSIGIITSNIVIRKKKN